MSDKKRQQPKIVAHRGYSAKHPENTMQAFRAAVAAGIKCIELDVHLSADGVPVVVHNHLLPDGTPVTEAHVLPASIPHLVDVAKWAGENHVRLFVEIKRESVSVHGPAAAARAVVHAMRWAPGWVCLSFDRSVLSHIPASVPTGFIGTAELDYAVYSIAQFRTAEPTGKPVIVYTAKSWRDVLRLGREGASFVMVDDCRMGPGAC